MKVKLRSLALPDKPAVAALANNRKIYNNFRDVFHSLILNKIRSPFSDLK